jgi:hypothetical protein
MADAAPGGEMLRVRFDLEGNVPPIWRTLKLKSSMLLDRVHDVVQAAFDWDEAHLHRFTDRDPYERLRPVDGEVVLPLQWLPAAMVDEPEDRPEEELDLGTLLAQGSGTAFYEYDLGDSWLLRMQLLDPRPAEQRGGPRPGWTGPAAARRRIPEAFPGTRSSSRCSPTRTIPSTPRAGSGSRK